jgi:hypothetical protein
MSDTPNLLQLQRQMQARVLHGDDALLAHIANHPTADVARRSRVYEDAYRLRLIEVLGNDFPVLKACLGVTTFDDLAGRYLADHPSRYFSVRYVGTNFSSWLNKHAAQRCAAYQPLAGLHWAELAAFEWAQGEVFDAADSDVVVPGDIAGVPSEAWPGLRLQLQPAIRWVSLHGNAPAFVSAHNKGTSLPEISRREQAIPWLLWRRGLDVYWRSLEADEHAALGVAREHATFGEICESLCAWHPDDAVALRAASLLKRWISDELIAGVDCDPVATAT